MTGFDIICGQARERVARLVSGAQRRLVIASPFVSRDGSELVKTCASAGLRKRGRVELVTDLNATHVAEGSLDPAALRELLELSPETELWHVPRLHAKVFVADGCRAIVGSANLTAGGLSRNIEYGVEIADPGLASCVERDMADIRSLGVSVSKEVFAKFSDIALEARHWLIKRQQESERMIERLVREAGDQLVRARLSGGPMHAVFTRTVLYLLERYGPMTTEQIHSCVQGIHPDLCDDTVDRVIEGRRFGKKWKHAVRTAQQHLKRQGSIELENGSWRLRQGR